MFDSVSSGCFNGTICSVPQTLKLWSIIRLCYSLWKVSGLCSYHGRATWSLRCLADMEFPSLCSSMLASFIFWVFSSQSTCINFPEILLYLLALDSGGLFNHGLWTPRVCINSSALVLMVCFILCFLSVLV
ncbi:unnamed protein product [Brassica rapa subsp. narinosa]